MCDTIPYSTVTALVEVDLILLVVPLDPGVNQELLTDNYSQSTCTGGQVLQL